MEGGSGPPGARTAAPKEETTRTDVSFAARRGFGQTDGAEAQIRTGDTGLFRAVLYQLSYLGANWRGRPDLNRRSLE